MSDANPTRWVWVRRGEIKGKSWYRCSCGTEKQVTDKNVKSGASRSCGCFKHEIDLVRLRTHGHSGTQIYGTWCEIIKRTENPKYKRYADWGGRGIKMCVRWRESFEAFYDDMGDIPEGMQIDRKDNDKGYWCGKSECPECGPLNREPNCKWSTVSEQQRNKRSNKNITFDGKTQCVTQWAREYQICPFVLHGRVKNGWDFHEALTTPVRRRRKRPDGS